MDNNIKEYITLRARRYGVNDRILEGIASQSCSYSEDTLFRWYCWNRARNWFTACPKTSCQECWEHAIQGVKEEMEGFRHDDRQVCREVNS